MLGFKPSPRPKQMDLGLSPFRPGVPVPIESFVGRQREIEYLHRMAMASTHDRLKVGFVAGELGIGKSSLVQFVRSRCEQEDDMTGCHVFLGGARDLNGMMRKICNQLLKESINQPWHEKVREFFGNHIRKVGAFGVTLELNLEDQDFSTMVNNFGLYIQDFIKKTDKQGLLLILDDVNGLANLEEVAHWFKSTVDELSISYPGICLCILVVGLEERRKALIQNQQSLARVFDLLDINPWTEGETHEFYESTFTSAGARISSEGLESLVQYAGGLPVFAHQLGESVWHVAQKCMVQELEIDKHTVLRGIVNGTEIIGRRFLDRQVFDTIRSEKYRSILKKMMSDKPIFHFCRSEIIKNLTSGEVRVFDNFLQRMKSLGVLMQDPSVRGGYRFLNLLYSLYCFSYASRI